jgi:hypothetical protein
MKGRRAVRLLAIIIPGVFVVVALGTFMQHEESTRGSPRSISLGGYGVFAPIPGDRVSFAEALTRVAYPLPRLPAVSETDFCTGEDRSLELLASWASPTSIVLGSRQAGFTYSHGIWISISPKSLFRFASASELPTLAEAFSVSDFPADLRDTTVRGHTAWAKDLDPTISCGDLAGPPGNAYLLDPKKTANIQWMERGVVIEIAGPLPRDDLISIAEGIVWE